MRRVQLSCAASCACESPVSRQSVVSRLLPEEFSPAPVASARQRVVGRKGREKKKRNKKKANDCCWLANLTRAAAEITQAKNGKKFEAAHQVAVLRCD